MSQNIHTKRYGSASDYRRKYSSSRRPSNYNRRKSNKQVIDPALFVRQAKPSAQSVYTPTHKFSDFAIHPTLMENIAARGFQYPSPIQDKSIPVALEGKDIIGLANTGTGKTIAFAVPIIHKTMTDSRSRALIVAPTRELAQQIETECKSVLRGTRVYTACLTGGSPVMPQVRSLQRNPQIVIGTPGRIKDHVNRGNIDLAKFNIVALDEVDRMLDMGFVNDITELLHNLSPTRQSLFFSATMDKRVGDLIRTFAQDPITISVITGNTSDNVEQNIVSYGTSEPKIEVLHDVLNRDQVAKALIFEETKRGVDHLARELSGRGFSVDSLHGNKSQGQRKRALNRFRNNEVTILVATDVAARGIDIADVTHVINYSTPQTYDDYVHRIGRAGRAGKTGYALTFVGEKGRQ